jgi:CBS domain-containing protein
MTLLVGDLASRPPATCRPHDTVQSAARIMAQRNVGSVVVVDDDRCAVGMLTDRDLVLRVVAPGHALDTPVVAVMSTDVVTIPDTATVLDAARQMMSRSCRRLPVVDEATGHVRGVISADDVLNRTGEEIDAINHCLAPMRRHLVQS